MIIRKATRADLLDVGRIADAAHWVSYEGLVRPETIGRLILRDFSPAALGRRLLQGGVFVAVAWEEVAGFTDGQVGPDGVHVRAIAVDTAMRRRGVASGLLAAVRALAADAPIAADVLVGNLGGERFYEANGFVPGEVQQGSLFGEEVVEQRWWSEAAGENVSSWRVASDG